MKKHDNTECVEEVRDVASKFHKNFSRQQFDKNRELVNDKIYVNSNRAIVVGGDKFVERIKRYQTPFPTLQLNDKLIIVDGNVAGVVYVLQGTHDGPYGSIEATGNKVNAYSIEFFTMDDQVRMKELLTITQLDRLGRQVAGREVVAQLEDVQRMAVGETVEEARSQRYSVLESYVQNVNMRYWAELEALFSENVKVDWNGQVSTGFQAVQAGVDAYLSALPDATLHLIRSVVEGEHGAIAYTLNGTCHAEGVPRRIDAHVGAFFMFDASHRIAAISIISNDDELQEQLKA